MTQRDWGILGSMLKEQYTYLSGFSTEVIQNGFSPGYLKHRSNLYVLSAKQSYERGKVEAISNGEWQLPSMPTQGSECQVNCKCFWKITVKKDRIHAFWRRTALESCPTCINRSIIWSPYEIFI